MSNQYLEAKDIQELMGVKKTKAYGIIKDLNNELKEKGIYTIEGKVLKQYFSERTGCVVDAKKDTPADQSKRVSTDEPL